MRHIIIITFFLLQLFFATSPILYAENSEEKDREAMAEKKQFFGQLLGTRPNWPNDMTPDEEKIMSAHFQYLQELVASAQVLMAGPVFDDPVFGLVIISAEAKEEAQEILDADPSVKAGLHTYKISEMRVSLMSDNPK